MSRDASPNSITYEYNSNHSSPYRRASPPHEHDILSQLKVQVFEQLEWNGKRLHFQEIRKASFVFFKAMVRNLCFGILRLPLASHKTSGANR